jgi:cell division protein FtsB
MKEKAYKYIHKVVLYGQGLQDVRILGQLLFVVIVLLISWSGVKAIQTNYGLQKHINELAQQTDVQKLKNTNLKLQNEYYKSSQYLELAARQNFGLAAPGEKELIVPESVALANTIETAVPQKQVIAVPEQTGFQQHVESWVNFFLHRSTN